MATAQIKADLEIDLATKADLASAVDGLKSAIVLPAQPRALDIAAATPVGVTAPFLIFLGAPSDAVVWDLRSLVLTGSDDHTTVANVTAAVYSGQRSGVGMALTDLAWTGLAIPSSTSWNAQVVIEHRQGLYLALSGTGVVAGLTLMVNALVLEVQAEDAPRYFG